MNRPRLSFLQIWNMSFGFFGIQFGWGLQIGNMSAIYQFLGADPNQLAILWLAAPVTGLVVQPLIGYYSDRTWTKLGRRRPFFLVGAILASIALIAMPNSSSLWMAAGLLWILDASVNISMEPFRAFVGDNLPTEQRKVGFAMQSLLIGGGAVLSLALPTILLRGFNISDTGGEGSAIPLTVHISFYVGAVVFFLAVLYTVLTSKEYPPEDMEAFKKMKEENKGILNVFKEIYHGITSMPKTMQQLAVVQFFTWFAMFCVFIYFVTTVAKEIFGGVPGDEAYLEGIAWGGLCMGVYNGVAFLFAFILLYLVRFFSEKQIHIVCLLVGGLSLASMIFVSDANGAMAVMVGLGIAWASILSMPYAMLSNAIPGAKMGFYMGVFNFFIVIPQIIASLSLGSVVEHLFDGRTLPVIVIGGASMLIAMIMMFRVKPATE